MTDLSTLANQLATIYAKDIDPSSTTLPEYSEAVEQTKKSARKQVADAQRAARAAGLGVITSVAFAGYAASEADAAPLGVPVPGALPASSSPIDGYAAPTGHQFTGGDGDVNSPTYFLTSSSAIFEAEGNAVLNTYNLPFSDATGVAIKGYDNSNPILAISRPTSIEEYTLDSGSLVPGNILSLSGFTGTATDVDWNLGSYFISTDGEGIRRVESDGSTDQVLSNVWKGLEVISFKDDTYDNPMMQVSEGSNNFTNIDLSGQPFGTPQAVNVFNSQDIEGIVYHQNGMGIVQNGGVALHNPQPYQSDMQENLVPEPTSLAMGLVALGVGLLAKRKNYTPKE